VGVNSFGKTAIEWFWRCLEDRDLEWGRRNCFNITIFLPDPQKLQLFGRIAFPELITMNGIWNNHPLFLAAQLKQ